MTGCRTLRHEAPDPAHPFRPQRQDPGGGQHNVSVAGRIATGKQGVEALPAMDEG
jgi:hypothetical protein